MQLVAITFIVGVVVGALGMWLIATRIYDNPKQMSQEWLASHEYDAGKSRF